MDMDITIKNYRCFPDTNPVKITIGKGFVAFVGVNNSGKSSLLRFFYEFRELFNRLSQLDRHLFRGSSVAGFGFPTEVEDPAEIFCNANDRDLTIEFRLRGLDETDLPPDYINVDGLTIILRRGSLRWTARLGQANGDIPPDPRFTVDGTLLRNADASSMRYELSHLLEAFKGLSNTLYVGAFRNAINIGSHDSYYDIKIGQAFVADWQLMKQGPTRLDNLAAFQVTEDIAHIFGFDDLEINPSQDNRTMRVFVDGKPYGLSELGSGLAQFIVVFANAARRKPAYILIDEPELNLHPSLQLIFLSNLGSFASEGVMFATHNLGLARAGANRVYSVLTNEDKSRDVRPLESTPRLSELLGEMSFSGYRELGFDKLLLAEGVTDIKTVQQFLRLYGKDHEILVLPLGGSQLINSGREVELAELTRITTNIAALVDSEKSKESVEIHMDRIAFRESCNRLGIECHILERRAIENYLTDRAIKKVKSDKYQALEPYQSLSELELAWSKNENWQIAREMTRSELNDTDLGQFLDSL